MTQYSENWSGEADGVYPSVLTKRWETGDETTVAANSNAEGEAAFTFEQEWSANAERLNSWNTVEDGDELNIEIVARFNINTTIVDHQFGIVLRGSGAAGSEAGYVFWVDEAGANILRLNLRKYTAGSPSSIVISLDQIVDYTLGDWLYLRCRVNGTAPGTLQARLWSAGDEEPADWHIDQTDSDHTSAGWNGPAALDGASNCEVDYLGGGTLGDTAPIVVDATGEIRITGGYAAIVAQEGDPETRITGSYATIVGTIDDPETRITGSYVQVVLTKFVPPPPRMLVNQTLTIGK